jgi:predicted ATPase/DNA-binding SARP family transcriptional activator
VRIAILGPLLVTDTTVPTGGRDIAGSRLRTLLIRLALDAGRTVGTSALVEAVWGNDPPAGAANALQTLVSRLRRALPPDALIADNTGYRIDATVDIHEFDQLGRAGREASDANSAQLRYEQALALWRGPALADVQDAEFARATIARLEEAKVTTTEEWFAARIASEPAGAVLPGLEELVAAHPLRERPHALLIGALTAAGRQADATKVYEQLRQRLSDELGLDPSPELAATYTAMLRGDRAGNLRPALTSFVGRNSELSRLTALIREQRLVTLVGPGGAGKTRLATEAARALADEFAGGVWMVELAPVREPDGVARALADSLQLREIRFMDLSSSADALDRVLGALASKDLLLVLDNCEHLIEASARLADALLATCHGVRIVTTSREPLAITGEALCPVGPLATPATNADAHGAASVHLFVDRAAAVKPGFALTDANAAAISEICRRLDGMPLAIELACARLRTLPLDQIAARLDDRFRLLTGGSRTALPRHQTLQAVVEWTWDLLATPERHLAARFSVFLDGATVDTIAGICGEACMESLAGLVDKSFVTLGDDSRYRMLETIRAYAAERLTEAGDAAAARTAHASFFAATAEHADLHMRGPEQVRWLRWISDERDNLTGALRWAIDSGDAATAVRLSGALGWFWLLCDFHVEALMWLGQALAMPGDVPNDARALALAHYGINLMVTDDAAQAQEMLAESRAMGCAHPVVALSSVMAGMFGETPELARAGLHELYRHPDPWVRAMGTTVHGILAVYGGQAEQAEKNLAKALAEFEAIGDHWARATLSSVLGEMRGLRGDRAGAIVAFQSAAALAEELGVPDVAAQMFVSMSLHKARTGDIDGARTDLEQARRRSAIGVSPQLTNQLRVAEAEILRRSGDFLGASERYHEALDRLSSIQGLSREVSAGLMTGLAFAELGLDNVNAARVLGKQIYQDCAQFRNRMALSMGATVLAAVADVSGDAERAAYLMGVGDGLRGLVDQGTPELADIVTSSRGRLGDLAYDVAYARGRALDLDGAIEALRLATVVKDAGG